MEKCKRWWKGGFITLIPLLLIVVVATTLVEWFFSFGSKFSVTDSPVLNISLFSLLLAVVLPILIGWLLDFRIVRATGVKILEKLPLGWIFKYFFTDEYAVKKREGSYKEVFFEVFPNTWTFGIAMNEFELPWFGNTGPMTKWLAIIGPPTTPFGMTSPLICRREKEVIYTGRLFGKTLVTVATFGTVLDIDDFKREMAKQAQYSEEEQCEFGRKIEESDFN